MLTATSKDGVSKNHIDGRSGGRCAERGAADWRYRSLRLCDFDLLLSSIEAAHQLFSFPSVNLRVALVVRVALRGCGCVHCACDEQQSEAFTALWHRCYSCSAASQPPRPRLERPLIISFRAFPIIVQPFTVSTRAL